MAVTITEILNQWAAYGVFSYVFPFLLIFAVVFAILEKTKVFGDSTQDKQKNVKGINLVIALAIAFLALLNDAVSTFFATIFPRFGIVLAVLLVILILMGLFFKPVKDDGTSPLKWVGIILAIIVVIWTWSDWQNLFGTGFQIQYFLDQYLPGLIVLAIVGGAFYLINKNS